MQAAAIGRRVRRGYMGMISAQGAGFLPNEVVRDSGLVLPHPTSPASFRSILANRSAR
jgi:hypothetical protein